MDRGGNERRKGKSEARDMLQERRLDQRQKLQLALSNAEHLEPIRGRVSLFGALKEHQIMDLLSYMSTKSFTTGEVIFNKGDLPSDIYIVLSGHVDFSVIKSDASLHVMDFKPGDCFGETAVIGIQPQIGEAIAFGNVDTLVLSREGLMAMAECSPKLFSILMMNIARDVSRRVHDVMIAGTSNPNFALQ